MPTIRDVALESGVSISTVSNVLTGAARPVSQHVRHRVTQAAQRLNYHPNAVAQALVRKRVDAIGVLSGIFSAADIVTNTYAAGVMAGILEEAALAGQNLMLYTQIWRGAANSMPMIRDRRADGMILIAPHTTSDIVSAVASVGLPLVTVAAKMVEGVASVDVDDALGIMLAVEHLANLGHKRIAHIHGNMDMASAQARLQAYSAAMTKFGLPVPPSFVMGASYSGDGAAEAARALLRRPDAPTAIVAANDHIAVAVVQAAQENGISVPRELSVIGYDDSPIASMTQPPLTTIRQPLAQIGALAVKLLLARIEDKDTGTAAHKLPPELILRCTTAAVYGD